MAFPPITASTLLSDLSIVPSATRILSDSGVVDGAIDLDGENGYAHIASPLAGNSGVGAFTLGFKVLLDTLEDGYILTQSDGAPNADTFIIMIMYNTTLDIEIFSSNGNKLFRRYKSLGNNWSVLGVRKNWIVAVENNEIIFKVNGVAATPFIPTTVTGLGYIGTPATPEDLYLGQTSTGSSVGWPQLEIHDRIDWWADIALTDNEIDDYNSFVDSGYVELELLDTFRYDDAVTSGSDITSVVGKENGNVLTKGGIGSLTKSLAVHNGHDSMHFDSGINELDKVFLEAVDSSVLDIGTEDASFVYVFKNNDNPVGNAPIMSKRLSFPDETSGYDCHYTVGFFPNLAPACRIGDGTNYDITNGDYDMYGNFQIVIVKHTNGEAVPKQYVNGVLKSDYNASSGIPTNLTSMEKFMIGAYPNQNNSIKGDLFEVRVYKGLVDEVALHSELDTFYSNPPIPPAPSGGGGLLKINNKLITIGGLAPKFPSGV